MAREERRGGRPTRRREQVIPGEGLSWAPESGPQPEAVAAEPCPPSVRRPDESIAEEIRRSLTRRPDLDASGVEVNVECGEVTLTGRVEDRDARWLAEGLVEAVSGVSLVHNRLRVSGG